MPAGRLSLLLSALLAAGPACARDYLAGPDDYLALLGHLLPGDHLVLRAGDYRAGLELRHLEGEAGRPIVIEGVTPERSGHGGGTRFLADDEHNTVSLLDVRHLVIRNLELDGGDQPVDAVKAEGHSHYVDFITLENLYIHDYAASQQKVGISSKCPAFGWVVRGNRIERVGTGMYFGNSDGGAPFVAGRIEDNRVTDTIGYNLQIKHQKPRPAGMPEADRSHDTILRGNLFAKDTAWPGPAARPNVLIGHAPKEGPGALDRVLIYGNLFWENPSEALFQGEGHLALYDNLFVNSQGPAIHIQPHNDVPRRVDLFDNTIIARSHGIRILHRDGAPPLWPQRVWGNLVFAAEPIRGGAAAANQTGDYAAAASVLKRPYAERERLDLAPRHLLAGANPPWSADPATYPDSGRDFAGHPRVTPVAGACTDTPCPEARHDP